MRFAVIGHALSFAGEALLRLIVFALLLGYAFSRPAEKEKKQ